MINSTPTRKRRIWPYFFGFFGLLLVIAIALPFIFKDKLIEQARLELNKQLNAEVRFSDIDVSFLSTFPNFGIQLDSFAIRGRYDFEDTWLIKTEFVRANIDFNSVLGGGPYKINSFYLERPHLNVVVLKNGKANYDIVRPAPKNAPAAASSTEFILNLAEYQIANGDLHYTDYFIDFETHLQGLNHKGSGDLTSSTFDLATQTLADTFSLRYGTLTYLNDVTLNADITLGGDMTTSKYTFKENSVQLNDLLLKADGFIQMVGAATRMDVKLAAPSTDFKQLLSVMPGIYGAEFKKAQTKGTFGFSAYAKGEINDKTGAFPAYGGKLNISNGSFQYPDLPKGVKDISTDVMLAVPGSNTDKMQLDVNQLHFVLGSNPFDAKFKLRTPISDPDIDGNVKGVINLAEVAQAVPMQNMENLNGTLRADITAKAKMSAIDAKDYEKVNMKGTLAVQQMNIKTKGQPATRINSMNLAFSPTNVQVADFNGNFGKSDLIASGTVDNPLAVFQPNKTMKGKFIVRSQFFDADEWTAGAATTNENAGLSTVGESPAAKPFDRFDFDLDGAITKMKYDKKEMRNVNLAGQFTPNKMDIRNLSAAIGVSDIALKGTLRNVFAWLFNGDILSGDVAVTSNNLDLNQFMTPASTTATAAPASVLLIPDLVELNINADLKKVKYTNLDLDNVKSDLLVKNKIARIQEGTANVIGGQVALAGAYNTSNPAKPQFDLKYDLRNFDFQRTFQSFNTIRSLAPLAQFMTGKFNTTMAFSGELGQDMTPKLESLNMAGMLHTLQAVISGLKPVQEISRQLNVSSLNNLDIKDTRNWFEVKNGNVHLVDTDLNVKDIALRIGGDHGIINQSMSYKLLAKVPRKLLESNAAGAAASVGLNALNQQAAKFGVNIKQGEFLNVLFTITGSMLKPQVAMKLLSADGQATIQEAVQAQVDAVVTKAKDSITTRANQELDKAKDKAKAEADRIQDSLTNRANQEIQKAKDKALEAATQKAKDMIGDELGTKVGDKVGTGIQDQLDKTQAGKRAKEEAEKLKGKLDDWDPFKKKKKG